MGKSIDPMLDGAKLGATTGSWPLPLLIGCDEFPAGYSLAGCSPAEPASASPAGNHPAPRRVARTSIFQQTALPFPSLRGHSQLQRGEQAGAVIDGDGKLDLAVANQSTNNVSILLGNGDGTFQNHVD